MLKRKQVNFLPLLPTVCVKTFYACIWNILCVLNQVVWPLSVFFLLICINVLSSPPNTFEKLRQIEYSY